jgi:hypothetical protein
MDKHRDKYNNKMSTLKQDEHMRRFHRAPTVLFSSRAYAIEMHEKAHEEEKKAVGTNDDDW